MSDIRFNNWKHQSGTGGVTQNSGGNVGIGSTLPASALDVGGDGKFTGVVTATSFSGNLSGTPTLGTGVTITASGMDITGVVTATSFVGSGANLTDVDAGATGGGSDRVFFENGVAVASNYTIGTTFGATANALSAGPITINAGVTVTVPSGSVYTVV